MSDIKRYELNFDPGGSDWAGGAEMEEEEDGDFVKHTDHIAERKADKDEIWKLKNLLKNIRSGLKEEIGQDEIIDKITELL